MKKIVIVSFLLLLISCSKNDKTNTTDYRGFEKLVNLSQNESSSIKDKLFYADSLKSSLTKRNNDSLTRRLYFSLANSYFNLYELNEYLKTSKHVLSLSTVSKDSINVAKANLYIGDYYFEKTKNDSAYFYYKNAEEIYSKLKDNKNLAKVILYKAYILLYEKDFLGSEIATIKALNLSIDDPVFKYECYVNLGSSLLGLKNYSRALEYHLKSLDQIKEIEKSMFNDVFKSQSYNNIGIVYLEQKKIKEAKQFFLHGLEIENIEKKHILIYTSLLDNLAYAEFKLNETESIYNFNKALKLRDSVENVSGIIISKLHLSEYYLSKNETQKAKVLNIEAYNKAKEANFFGEVLQTLELLPKTDPENGLKYAKEYINISDSLYNAERETRNKLARIEYETDEIIQEKELLSEQKKILLWVSLALISIGMLLYIILYLRSKQKELVFAQEQQNANQEIYKLMINQQLKIDEVRNKEKNRIAKELHDGIMNKLTSTRLNLFILSRRRDEETIQKCITHINDIQNIEKEVRTIAHELNNDIFSQINSFNNILNELIKDQNTLFEPETKLEIDPQINWENIDIAIKMNLYRIIQEALNNCNKYANATKIEINIYKDVLEKNVLSIKDNGIGFKLNKKKKGIGLKNMIERAESIGGICTVNSKINRGTSISIKF